MPSSREQLLGTPTSLPAMAVLSVNGGAAQAVGFTGCPMVRHDGKRKESGSKTWSEQLWVVGAKEERVWRAEEQVPGVAW